MKIVGFEANGALHLGLIALDHAEMQRAVGFETDDFHGRSLTDLRCL